MKNLIQGPHDVCMVLSTLTCDAAVERLEQGTDARVQLTFEDDGITLSAAVPNSDFRTATYRLTYPFTEPQMGLRIAAVEEECEDLWEWSLGMGDVPPVEDYGFKRV